MSNTEKSNAQYLAEIAIAYSATALKLVALGRNDLAAYFMVKAVETAAAAKSATTRDISQA